MRCTAEPSRSLHLLRLAVLASISATVAACSVETSRFDSNPFHSRQQSSSNEVTGSSAPKRTASVQSAPLPAPSTATMQAPATRPVATSPVGGSSRISSYQPARVTPEVTGAVPHRPAQTSAKSGWSWEGGTAITVQPGDTIDGIVKRYGVPAYAIAEANNLPNGSTLRPGQRLVIPKQEATGSTIPPRVAASRPPAPAASAPASSGPYVHVIAPGETLMKLSRQYQMSLVEIARANNIPPHTMVKVGDRIVIPGARAQQRIAAQPAQPKPVAAPTEQVKPAAPVAQKVATIGAAPVASWPPANPPATANVVTPAAHNPEPPKVKQDVTSAMPSFRWPANGRVITGFGPKPTGQQNDGINISVPEGTAIKAAEDGVVAYAGNELKTYGNLVLIRHSNGYVTAYAHASEILVKRDDTVKRGQVIAKAGQTGTVTAPQLHFEIRKGSTPIDPMPLLARAGNG